MDSATYCSPLYTGGPMVSRGVLFTLPSSMLPLAQHDR